MLSKKFKSNKFNKNNNKNKRYNYFKRQYRPYDVSDLPDEYEKWIKEDNRLNFKLPEFKPKLTAERFLVEQTPKYLKIVINKVLNKYSYSLNKVINDTSYIKQKITDFTDKLAYIIVPVIKNTETIKQPTYTILSQIDSIVVQLFTDLVKFENDEKIKKSIYQATVKFNQELKMHILFAIEIAQLKVEKEEEEDIKDYHDEYN